MGAGTCLCEGTKERKKSEITAWAAAGLGWGGSAGAEELRGAYSAGGDRSATAANAGWG